MFVDDSSIDDSFDAFVVSKTGHKPFQVPVKEAQQQPERKKKTKTAEQQPKGKEEEEEKPPSKVVVVPGAVQHKQRAREFEPQMGGRVALRATAPAGKRHGLRESLGLRRSAPSKDAHHVRKEHDHSLTTGSTQMVMSGMEDLLEKTALRLSAEQIRYVVGGEECLVIGGTSGIGKAICDVLTDYGADVISVGRRHNPDVHKSIEMDLSTVKSQVEFCNRIDDVESLHLIVFCIAAKSSGKTRKDNGEGIEEELAVSFLSRRVILDGLLERGLSPKCRVFILNDAGEVCSKKDVSNLNAERGYDQKAQAHNCVVSNDALVLGMRSRKLHAKIWAVNPGVVAGTDLRNSKYRVKAFGRVSEAIVGAHTLTPEEYAEDVLIHIIANPNLSVLAFGFGWRRHVIHPTEYLSDPKNVETLWELADELIHKAKQ